MPYWEPCADSTPKVLSSPRDHYCIPPLERVNLAEILELVRDKRYFVLHAPRQTGKTSILLALQDLLNGGSAGQYRCVYVNVEPAQAAGENVEHAMRAILSRLASRAHSLGDTFLHGVWSDVLAKSGAHDALGESLTRWCMADSRPLVVLIDEIDTLVGDSLISVLRQLRAGYDLRPGSFPQSVVLCGVRDVRDYRIRSGSGYTAVAGGSAFNIKAASLRIGDFTRTEVRALLAAAHRGDRSGVHPGGSGQGVETDSGPAHGWSMPSVREPASTPRPDGTVPARSTDDDILEAQERLILSRQTHLDQLADKLQEDRVRRVVEPLLSGGDERPFSTRDLEYVRDLGLVARDNPLRIANPVYAEVVPRELTYATQAGLVQDTTRYVDSEGRLDVDKLLGAFQSFFREHSEHWLGRFDYAEAGPQLLLQAFLQRVANGGGRIEREYGLGRGRTDLSARVAPQRYLVRDRRQVRDRMQGAAQEPGTNRSRGPGADGRLHGPLRKSGRPPRHRRPKRRQDDGRTSSSATMNAWTTAPSRCGECDAGSDRPRSGFQHRTLVSQAAPGGVTIASPCRFPAIEIPSP